MNKRTKKSTKLLSWKANITEEYLAHNIVTSAREKFFTHIIWKLLSAVSRAVALKRTKSLIFNYLDFTLQNFFIFYRIRSFFATWMSHCSCEICFQGTFLTWLLKFQFFHPHGSPFFVVSLKSFHHISLTKMKSTRWVGASHGSQCPVRALSFWALFISLIFLSVSIFIVFVQ